MMAEVESFNITASCKTVTVNQTQLAVYSQKSDTAKFILNVSQLLSNARSSKAVMLNSTLPSRDHLKLHLRL